MGSDQKSNWTQTEFSHENDVIYQSLTNVYDKTDKSLVFMYNDNIPKPKKRSSAARMKGKKMLAAEI